MPTPRRATWTAPSPTTTRPSDSTRNTPGPTATGVMPTTTRATWTAPSPTATRPSDSTRNAPAYLNRGFAYGKKGDLDRAIADYDEAIRLDPKCAVYHLNRGDTYRLKGEYDKALADYEETLALLPLALKDKTSPNYEILDHCVNLIEGYKALDNDRKPGFIKVHTALEKELPDSAFPPTLEGIFFTDYAWDARTGKWAKDVTEAQSELFRERLARAEAALERAWRLDPNNARAATQMLRDPNRMTNFGTSFDVEMGVARKDRTHGQTLTTR